MRIALVCNEYPPAPHGGIGTFVKTFAHGLADAGHHVTVVGMGEENARWQDRSVGVIVLSSFRLRGMAWLLNRRKLTKFLEKQARADTFDLVEVPEFQGWLPFGLRSCPAVVRLHLSYTSIARQQGSWVRPTLTWCEKQTLRKVPFWTSVSDYVLESTRQLFRLDCELSRTVYLPAAPEALSQDVAVAEAAGAHSPYVLYFGAVTRRKGALALAAAARLFLPSFPELKVVYVGREEEVDGNPISAAARAAVGPELSQRLLFAGQKSHEEVLSWIKGARAVVLPSKLESFGLAAVEAMAMGVPVIYTTAASGPEVVEHGVTGLLCDPERPDDIAAKVATILNEPERAAHMAERARRAVTERFSVSRCVSESLDFYAEVMKVWKSKAKTDLKNANQLQCQ